MARDLGPKCRICRREGVKLFLKGERCLTEKCAVERRSYPPGEHGRGRIKQSQYLLQLREKQKARRYYGLLEKQFRSTYEKATRGLGAPGENLLRMLETRLDNVVYRLGFAGLARAGAPARPPRPLPGERPAGQHPELRRPPERRGRAASRAARSSSSSATRPTSPRRSRRGSRPTMTASPARCSSGPSATRSTRPSRNRSSSSSTPSNARRAEACLAPDEDTKGSTLATRTSLMDFQIPKIVHEDADDASRRLRHRAARPRLRPHVRELASPRAAVVARGRGGDRREDRGRRARVHDASRRARGRDRHHPQPQEPHRAPPRRVARDRGLHREEGPGRRHGGRHRGACRPRDPEPGPRDRPRLRQGQARDDAHDRPRPRATSLPS